MFGFTNPFLAQSTLPFFLISSTIRGLVFGSANDLKTS